LVLGHYTQTGQHCAFHPVTRLDRDTFGIVLLAKNSHVHNLLQMSQLEKTYHALVYGGPIEDHGIIDAPIARRPLPSLLRYIGPEGKSSVTEYWVIGRFDRYAKLALRPITGRTHQLRVHCAYMGFPILGDPQYGSEASQTFSEQFLLNSQALCAKRLEFIHPMTEQPMCVESCMDANLSS
jgi:23S rRNA pseudouridine1911/1915/1917 synthase